MVITRKEKLGSSNQVNITKQVIKIQQVRITIYRLLIFFRVREMIVEVRVRNVWIVIEKMIDNLAYLSLKINYLE